MTTRPTHVMVASPVDCTTCKGTGKCPDGYLSFERIINEQGEELCPKCRGAKLAPHLTTLEEFAKLLKEEAPNFTSGGGSEGKPSEQKFNAGVESSQSRPAPKRSTAAPPSSTVSAMTLQSNSTAAPPIGTAKDGV